MFYLRFVCVFIPHSFNKRISMESMQKMVKSSLNNGGFNSWELAIYRDYANRQSQMFSQPCK